MANAAIDENGRQTLTGALNTDGATVVRVKANATTHGLVIDDGITGSDHGNHGGNAILDENSRQTLTAVASDGSGEIVIVYATSGGALMVDSS